MRTIARSEIIEADPHVVWDLVRDLPASPRFFVGITLFEPIGEVSGRVGDTYRVLMQVGSIQAGGRIRITDIEAPYEMAWTAESGTKHDARIRVTPHQRGCRVRYEIRLDLAGGMIGRLTEVISGRMVARNLAATLANLRHLCEFDVKYD